MVVSIFRLDRYDFATLADPIGEANREKADIRANVDNQRSVRNEFLESVDWASLKIFFVDSIEGKESPFKNRNSVNTKSCHQTIGPDNQAPNQPFDHCRSTFHYKRQWYLMLPLPYTPTVIPRQRRERKVVAHE